MPDPWNKLEEYYYWEQNGGQLSPNIIETLRVRETGAASYDAARPISWYQVFPSGARSYYTALGHAVNNYTDPNNEFRQFIRDALCWCVDADVALPITAINTQVISEPSGDIIEWQTVGDYPVGIKLWGAREQNQRHLLASSAGNGEQNGRFFHPRSMASRSEWYFYQIESIDEEGVSFTGDWTSSPPTVSGVDARLVLQSSRVLVLQLSGLETAIKAQIVDLNGRSVQRLQLNNGVNDFGYGDFPPGHYAIIFDHPQLSSLAFVQH
ncbi:MAG: ThuA domain-containing protein [Bacteroidota bacterium]